MRVLGIDPGTRFMGFGVVEESRGQLTHIGHGVIRTDPSQALELRLRTLHSELGRAVALFRPHAMAVEGVFTCRNARSALILGHARGVALLAASQADLRVFEYAPARVKRSVGAGGAAAKDAVARMVKTFLKMESLE
ncbi:MAG TPA: crossover junction endodeoxyribonuclease RuvC, partial [Myxococcaceae bacterium]|nr:crossover junction endodeoxyribonuclease RuvC [Myxococcaceae bacterium]